MPRRETSARIDATAAAWAARLDGRPLSAEEKSELEAWAALDPRRAGALARAMAVLSQFDHLKSDDIE